MTATVRKPLPEPEPIIVVEVDWTNLPFDKARSLYANLKAEFEKAGRILNARSMPTGDYYTCFICKTRHFGEPRGKDYSRQDPATRLMTPVLICGEACWLKYQQLCIGERKAREMGTQLGYDIETMAGLFRRYEGNLDGLINELGQRIMKANKNE